MVNDNFTFNKPNQYNMYKFLFSILLIATSFLASAQDKSSYKKEWKIVTDLEVKGLNQSARNEARKIFTLATADKNQPQQIKSAMYELKSIFLLNEENINHGLKYFDSLLYIIPQPGNSIVLSMKATAIDQFLQSNRYLLYDRTKILNEQDDDITTWSLAKLHNTITSLYLSSIQQVEELKKVPISTFTDILSDQENTLTLRPTLYDFLAFRALAYLSNPEQDLLNPAQRFVIDGEDVFSPAKEFIHITFKTNDTISDKYRALMLYRDLLRNHLNDYNLDAFLDADLQRLQFVYAHSVSPFNKAHYEKALKQLERSYPKHTIAMQAAYQMALLKQQDAAEGDTTGFINAINIANSIITQNVDKNESNKAKNLIEKLKEPSFNLELESVNLPNQPFRILVSYKNTAQLFFKIIPITEPFAEVRNRRETKEYLQSLLKKSDAINSTIKLPEENDYRQHSVEIKFDALKSGKYYLFASLKPSFSFENNSMDYQIIQISQLAYFSNDAGQIFVVDRNNGNPIQGAIVQQFILKYNYSAQSYQYILKDKVVTNKDGIAIVKKSKNYESYHIEILYKDERFTSEDARGLVYYGKEERKPEKRIFIFTDRSIYRPGQPLYYKGIYLVKDTAILKSKALAEEKVNIKLYDVNGTEIATANHTTNTFGSFSGKFDLPEGQLNGSFYLRDDKGLLYHSISVEEYKRPKFEVVLENPTTLYRLQDTISVFGKAKAYAGNNISGAKVIYSVTRKSIFPFYRNNFFYSKSVAYPRNEMEITYGETRTNDAGSFTITFPALADEEIPKQAQPIFYFIVFADITDINGETRSQTIAIPVSYQLLQISTSIEKSMLIDSVQNIKIYTKNTLSSTEKAFVEVRLSELTIPNKIFRKRYWQKPDRYLYPKEVYSGFFPFDIYSDEDEPNNYPIKKIVYSKADTTSLNGVWDWKDLRPESGFYKLDISSIDKYGETVNYTAFFEITNNKFSSLEAFTIAANKNSLQPGQTTQYTLSCRYDDVWLLQNLKRAEENASQQWVLLRNNRPETKKLIVTEKDRGGIVLNYIFVKHNNFYNYSTTISVPWTNKELQLKLETFRNKVLPNSKETWSIHISGNQKDKVTAEALINMYDASLDQFKSHSWPLFKYLWPVVSEYNRWVEAGFNSILSSGLIKLPLNLLPINSKRYYELTENNWSYVLANSNFGYRGNAMGLRKPRPSVPAQIQYKNEEHIADGALSPAERTVKFTPPRVVGDSELFESDTLPLTTQNNSGVESLRTNFKETAFFYPELKTDSAGNISFTFTMPEALTKWKLMTMAHTPDLQSGILEAFTITQKSLMVQPNLPRFLREGDRMELETKVVNMDSIQMTGTIQLAWIDEATGASVDGWFNNILPLQHFTVDPGKSESINFPFVIPQQFNGAVKYRIIATTADGKFSDGEEAILPVLTNRTLVTESLPISLRGTGTKHFTFNKLLTANNSSTISHQSLTIEYTSNPVWYAVQALPYLMEYPYECAEQTFNRYYANALASLIITRTPRIKTIFSQWKSTDTSALISNLQKNQELKTMLLEETPWVLESRNETEQKRRIGLLFDLITLSNQQSTSLAKLAAMQTPNGGFAWFNGGPEDRFMTQYIITGMAKLKMLGVSIEQSPIAQTIVLNAIAYLDKEIIRDYDELLKRKVNLKADHLNYTVIQYLYMRSLFPDKEMNDRTLTVNKYYLNQVKRFWINKNLFSKAMIAISLFKNNDQKAAKDIIKSLQENAIINPELGTYWKENIGGYFWFQAPIESQSIAIEAFSLVTPGNTFIDDLKTWLLKNKQTNNWRTTKATAEACYALLMRGTTWVSSKNEVTIKLGNKTIKSDEEKAEAGTGYFKTVIPGNKVQQGMGNIEVSISSEKDTGTNLLPSWGAVYWQYFEEIDKITRAITPLYLSKKLYLQKNTDTGPVLEEIKEGSEINVGAKIIVRLHLKCDRDMEYIHLKDMRASGLEPVNVISQFKYQGGLWYYETTRDASSNFFFDKLPKGSYIFEYPLFATHAGDFSLGIATIQSMYAPEFTSHSEGMRIHILPQIP